jgi:HTH-type transcriptional regulator/antitoxin MqsA
VLSSRLTCPICEEGSLSARTYADSFLHNGNQVVVPDLEGYCCDVCGATPIFTDQIRRNQAKVIAARQAMLAQRGTTPGG